MCGFESPIRKLISCVDLALPMYSDDEGIFAVRTAREVVEAHVRGNAIPEFDFPESFNAPRGVFTTINTYPQLQLRGCIGYPGPYFPLKEALVKSAIEATHDPRFYPLIPEELDRIVIEVSILTPPRLIEVKSPREYLKKIKIGRDGLVVQKGFARGLLLPQVPVEEKWDVEEFLRYTCIKAGLDRNCWKDKKTQIFWFSAEVFAEESPRGDIHRKELEGEDD